jgi:hypothetical protein
MRRNTLPFRLIAFATLLAMPLQAHAAGGADISLIFLNLITAFWPLWVSVAVLVVTIAGFTLMVSTDEGKLAKSRAILIAVGIGGIIITIINVLTPLTVVTFFYNGLPGTILINTGASLGAEVQGIGSWLTAMTAVLGILVIIIAVLRAVTSFNGDEASYTNARWSILHVIIGLIIIGAALVIENVFFILHEPGQLLGIIGAKVLIVLNVISTIAVVILIYAGLRMVISFGKEDEFTAAKSLALRVIVGLLILAVSYVLVYVVVTLF